MVGNLTEREREMAKAEQQTPDPDVTGSTEPVTQAGDEYKTQGRTRLATHDGYAFRSSDQDLPEITPEGINVTKEQADAVLAESATYDGHVFLVETTEG